MSENELYDKNIPNVLVIDDDEGLLEYYSDILTPPPTPSEELAVALGEANEGGMRQMSLDLATSGEQGLSLVEKSLEKGTPYSVIICDMRMPGGWDGIETIHRIREIEDNAYILVVTSWTDYTLDAIEMAAKHGVLLIHKPFHEEEIKTAVMTSSQHWSEERSQKALIDEALQAVDDDFNADTARALLHKMHDVASRKHRSQ